MPKVAVKRKPNSRIAAVGAAREIAAGEFKAHCLGLMREIADSGSPVLVTSRGKPLVEVVPARDRRNGKKGTKRDDFLGRLEGIMKINGDPDDLIKPVFALEDYDMLK